MPYIPELSERLRKSHLLDKNYTDETLKTLNAYHKVIKFTVEMENNNKLAYLDTTITKDRNIIKLD